MTASISTIIVTYNSSGWLPRCLESLKSQSLDIFELINVDNNSSDDSVELIKRYFPQARLIKNNDNMGFSYAVNQGIRNSEGNFIFLLNPDVILERDFLERLFNVKVDDVRTMITMRGEKKAIVKLNKEFKAIDIATKLKLI